MRVDLMIIGAQKCGVSTLFSILDRHPQTNGSNPKEPHFFSLSDNWRNGLDQYHGVFKAKPGALNFEASTTTRSIPCGTCRFGTTSTHTIRT